MSSPAEAAAAARDRALSRFLAVIDELDSVAALDNPGVSLEALRVLDHLLALPWFDPALVDAPLVRRFGWLATLDALRSSRVLKVPGGRQVVERRFADKRLDELFGRTESHPPSTHATSVVAFTDEIVARLRLRLPGGRDGRGGGGGQDARAHADDPDTFSLVASLTPDEALQQLEARFEAADAIYDLAACDRLLRAVEGRPNLGWSKSMAALEAAAARRRRYLASRVATATAFYRTSRYFRREDVHEALDAFMRHGPWCIHIHAMGGMGKTLLLQWLIARHCTTWERRIPVARFDYDGTGPAERAPHRVAFALAEQLRAVGVDLFDGLLSSHRDAIPHDFHEHFAGVLRDVESARPLVLVLDTLEVAMHDPQVGEILACLRDISHDHHGIRVILAGRYSLAEKAPALWTCASGAQELVLRRFDEVESARFAREQCRVERDDVAVAIARRGGGLPFKVALLAEIAEAEQLGADAVLAIEDVDLEYLIVRIVNRLEPVVRWAVRYGVLPRELTKAVFETVLLPHVMREAAAAELDDRKQGLADRHEPHEAFPTVEDPGANVWEKLLRYQSGASWLVPSTTRPDSFTVHPDVREPMRRLLRKQLVTAQIHRDLARYFEREAAGAATGPARTPESEARWAHAEAESLHHRFMVGADVALAERFVESLRRVAERAPDEVACMASVAFDGDDLATAAVRKTDKVVPYLDDQQATTVLALVADAVWMQAKTAVEKQRALGVVEPLLERVARGPALGDHDAARVQILRAERNRVAHGKGLDATSPGVGTSGLDLETRFRALLVEAPMDRAPDEAYRTKLLALYREAVAADVEPRVREAVTLATWRELLEEDRPEVVVYLFTQWRGAFLGSAAAEVAAEALIRTGTTPSKAAGTLDKSAQLTFEARFLAFRDDVASSPRVVGPATYDHAAAHLGALRAATRAEIDARHFHLDALDELFAAYPPGLAISWVSLWVARMYLYGLGDLLRTESHLRAIEVPESDSAGDISLLASQGELAFERDIVQLAYLNRIIDSFDKSRTPERDGLLERIAMRAERGRPRHRFALALVSPGDDEAREASVGAAIASPFYRARLRLLYQAGGFSPEDVRRCRTTPLWARSAGRAAELVAEAARSGDPARLLAEAATLYRQIGDVGAAARIEVATVLDEPVAATAAGAPRNTFTFLMDRKRSPLHEHFAREPLASSSTINQLVGTPALHDLFHAKAEPLGRDVDAVAVTAEPALRALPLERGLHGGKPLSVQRDFYRRRWTMKPARCEALNPQFAVVGGDQTGVGDTPLTAWSMAASAYDKVGIRCVSAAWRQFFGVSAAHFAIGAVDQKGETPTLTLDDATVTPHVLASAALNVRLAVFELSSQGLSTYSGMRSIVLRNAFVAEFYELSSVDVVLAVPAFAGSGAALGRLAEGLSQLLLGRAVPMDVARSVRALYDEDPTVVDLALFCDNPYEPITPPTPPKPPAPPGAR